VPQLASLDQERIQYEAPSAGTTEMAVFFLEQAHRRSVAGFPTVYVRMARITSRNQKKWAPGPGSGYGHKGILGGSGRWRVYGALRLVRNLFSIAGTRVRREVRTTRRKPRTDVMTFVE